MSGYVMIPGWLLQAQPSGNAVLIYATLASFGTFDTAAGTYEECRPALATIVERSGMSLSNVKRAIAELLDLKAVTRTERFADDGRTQLPSVYRVVFGAIVGPGGSAGGPPPPSTGGPRGGPRADQNQEPSTQNPDTKKPSASPRGTRVPDDFKPSDEMVAWARQHAPGVGWREHDRFMDYWRAQPGQRGVKLDWVATWRNWMRKAADDRIASARPTSGPPLFEERREQRQQEQRTAAQIADQLIAEDPKLPIAEALRLARELLTLQGQVDGKSLNGRAPTGYIDGEVIDDQGVNG